MVLHAFGPGALLAIPFGAWSITLKKTNKDHLLYTLHHNRGFHMHLSLQEKKENKKAVAGFNDVIEELGKWDRNGKPTTNTFRRLLTAKHPGGNKRTIWGSGTGQPGRAATAGALAAQHQGH